MVDDKKDKLKTLKERDETRKKEMRQAAEKLHKKEVAQKAATELIIPIPQMRSVDPSTLFSREERVIFETHHQQRIKLPTEPAVPANPQKKVESLEEAVHGAPKPDDKQFAFQYGKKLEETASMMYKGLADMTDKIGEKGYMNAQDKEKIDFYKNTLEQIHDAVGHHPENEPKGAMAMVYGGLEKISAIENQMGYAKKGGGGNPKYRI